MCGDKIIYILGVKSGGTLQIPAAALNMQAEDTIFH